MRNELKKEYIEKLRNDGKSVSDIAKELGCHVTAIYYYLNPKRRQEGYDLATKRRKENKKFAVEYKGNQCSRCGYCKCSDALVFHHKNPYEKDLVIAGTTVSKETLQKELDKTILLCSNCHIEFHAGIWSEDEMNKFQLIFYPTGINTGKGILPLSKRRRKYDNIG